MMKRNPTLFEAEAEVFFALSHPTRLEILALLRDGESCVCHIQAMLDRRQAYISQHLYTLRHAGLINSRKDGVRVYYQISDPALFEVIDRAMGYLQEAQNLTPDLADPAGLEEKKKHCNCPQCQSKANNPTDEELANAK